MFLIRSVNQNDVDDIFELSELVSFINLPAKRDIIEKMVQKSITSFEKPSSKLEENCYIFALEDTSKKKVIGISLIHARHGTENHPHYYLKVGQEHKYSPSMSTGFIHGTLKLGLEQEGYTELGSLVVHPNYRGHKEKLGKQISFARLLYLGLYPQRFMDQVHSELMPPLDKDGNSPLWEAIGRRFMNMNYQEADELSRENKDFILNLYPSDNIYQTLLPIEARLAIGKVGEDTQPVKAMLESAGFTYTNEVDPFDGGPHYRCPLKEILPIKKIRKQITWQRSTSPYNYLPYLAHLQDSPFISTLVMGHIIDDVINIDQKSGNIALVEKYAENKPLKLLPLKY